MKLTLGLCSYGNFLKVSIYNGRRFYSRCVKCLNQEEILFRVIKQVLRKSSGGFKDFDNICFVNGPGRFTGIRISYTFAGIYNILTGAKLHPVSTFDCLAYNLYEKLCFVKADIFGERFFSKSKLKADIVVVLRAFKDEFFIAYYKLFDGNLLKIKNPLWLKSNELIKKLVGFRGYVIGDKEEYSDIYKFIPDSCLIADEGISLIKPENIIKSALYFKNKDLKPIYLKPARYEQQ